MRSQSTVHSVQILRDLSHAHMLFRCETPDSAPLRCKAGGRCSKKKLLHRKLPAGIGGILSILSRDQSCTHQSPENHNVQQGSGQASKWPCWKGGVLHLGPSWQPPSPLLPTLPSLSWTLLQSAKLRALSSSLPTANLSVPSADVHKQLPSLDNVGGKGPCTIAVVHVELAWLDVASWWVS